MMNGNKLVSKLQALGAPGCENLVGAHFDYLFHKGRDSFTFQFWQWFVDNITEADVFSDDDLRRYDDLVDKSAVLSANRLEEFDNCLGSLFGARSSETKLDENLDKCITEEDIVKLEKQIEEINLKRSVVSQEKLELQRTTQQRQDNVHQLELEVSEQERLLKAISTTHTNASNDLTDKVKSIAAQLVLFNEVPEDEAVFPSQLNLQDWKEYEEKFAQAVTEHVGKQFESGLDSVTAGQDSHDLIMLLACDREAQLVRGQNQQEYVKSTNELNRVSRMIDLSERDLVDAELERAQLEGEVDEARLLLKHIRTGTLPQIHPLITEKAYQSEEKQKKFERELKNKRTRICEQSSNVSEWERIQALSNIYKTKQQRQNYFMDKIKYVEEILLSQKYRQDVVAFMLKQDSSVVSNILQQLEKIKQLIEEETNQFNERMAYLDLEQEERSKTNHQNGCVHSESDACLQILKENSPPYTLMGTKNYSNDSLQSRIDSLSHEYSTSQADSRLMFSNCMEILAKMRQSASTLEVCLSGISGRLPSMPLMFLKSPLDEKETKLMDTVYDFQENMMCFIKDYESKKRMLNLESSMGEKVLVWVHQMAKKV